MLSGWKVLHSLLRVSKLFALCPISLTRMSNDSLRYPRSHLIRALNVLPFFVLLVGGVLYIKNLMSEYFMIIIPDVNLSNTQSVLRNIERICVILPGWIVTFYGTTSYKNLIKIVKGLRQFDSLIVIHNEFSVKNIILMITYFLFASILMAVETLFWHNPFKNYKEIPYMSYRILKICGFLFGVQISVLYKMLVHRFNAINNELRDLRGSRGILRKLGPVLGRDFLSCELARLSVAHEALCDVTDLVSDTFGLRMLLVVSFLGLRLTIGIFFSVLMTPNVLAKALQLGLERVNRTLLAAPWCVIDALAICVLAILANNVCTEASRTACMLQKINNSALSPAAKEEVYIFQNKLDSRKICISACGLFELNNSFLTMISGGVVSFLLILFQFHVSDLVTQPTAGTAL